MREHRVTTIGLVTVDDEPVTHQQQALVTALALHRQGGATIDMLVDALWVSRTPATARKSVQNQIARIRQQFGADLIVTRGDRYCLGATTDADTFHQLELHADRPTLTAAEECRIAAALAAWSGDPYAELMESPLAQAERARLEHTRMRLVETLAISRLSRSATDGVSPATIIDLSTRTSTHPLHERAWKLLVAALHLSGRRTEALAEYERFRSILAGQLDVEPSPDFKQLRAIIATGQVLDTASVVGEPARPTHAPFLVSA